MNKLNKKTLTALQAIAMITFTASSNAGEEPSSESYKRAEIAHTEKVMKNAQDRAIDLFKKRVSDCKAFGGRMTSADICHVDQSQLFYCNTYDTAVNSKCVASKTIQTVVNVNGLAIGQPLKPVWRERNGTSGLPHGTVPAPPAFILILMGIAGLTIAHLKRR